ncbi:hypothetical protein [Nocardioides dongkuii]|uniref:hypothetical protein n=1 Tax=Nocardioides dongkuii TaxID=2760089 RepID=UPI0015FC3DF4|nr:hypothetical protein [Nocardioides dongkuii]
MAGARRLAENLAISVHGDAGVLDLVVPPGATADDVAEEYAARAGTARPVLLDRIGRPLHRDRPLFDAGVGPGDLLVAVPSGAVPSGPPTAAGAGVRPRGRRRGSADAWWCGAAAAAALLAGWCAAHADRTTQDLTVALLAVAALLAVLPVGSSVAARLCVAPVFGGAAAFALSYDPAPERLPLIVGTSALAAAVVAAVGRALDERADEALRIWMLAGTAVFALTGLCTLAGVEPRTAWAVLLIVAVLLARFVPGLAVEVPDQYLLDLERLAVTAWSARERPTGRRGRTLVPPDAVAEVARRGTRLVVASCAAVLATVAVSAPMVLATATLPIDRIGARVLVGLSGAALLLAGRSHRNVPARVLLRTAGLGAWAALAFALHDDLSTGELTTVALVAAGLGAVMVVAAVATGRGWRSAWWSRRAEVAEGLAGSGAIASVLVAIGLFRGLWELTS